MRGGPLRWSPGRLREMVVLLLRLREGLQTVDLWLRGELLRAGGGWLWIVVVLLPRPLGTLVGRGVGWGRLEGPLLVVEVLGHRGPRLRLGFGGLWAVVLVLGVSGVRMWERLRGESLMKLAVLLLLPGQGSLPVDGGCPCRLAGLLVGRPDSFQAGRQLPCFPLRIPEPLRGVLRQREERVVGENVRRPLRRRGGQVEGRPRLERRETLAVVSVSRGAGNLPLPPHAPVLPRGRLRLPRRRPGGRGAPRHSSNQVNLASRGTRPGSKWGWG